MNSGAYNTCFSLQLLNLDLNTYYSDDMPLWESLNSLPSDHGYVLQGYGARCMHIRPTTAFVL